MHYLKKLSKLYDANYSLPMGPTLSLLSLSGFFQAWKNIVPLHTKTR